MWNIMLDPSRELVKKLEDKNAVLCVVGLGQVGLPTALSFLKLGYHVIGYDVDEKLIRRLKQGIVSSPEKGFRDLVTTYLQNKSFSLSISADVLVHADVIIICVATPLTSNSSEADMRFLKSAIEEVAKSVATPKLIVIESTIPPKTMKEYVIPL